LDVGLKIVYLLPKPEAIGWVNLSLTVGAILLFRNIFNDKRTFFAVGTFMDL
jgi:hypothetical protein